MKWRAEAGLRLPADGCTGALAATAIGRRPASPDTNLPFVFMTTLPRRTVALSAVGKHAGFVGRDWASRRHISCQSAMLYAIAGRFHPRPGRSTNGGEHVPGIEVEGPVERSGCLIPHSTVERCNVTPDITSECQRKRRRAACGLN